MTDFMVFLCDSTDNDQRTAAMFLGCDTGRGKEVEISYQIRRKQNPPKSRRFYAKGSQNDGRMGSQNQAPHP